MRLEQFTLIFRLGGEETLEILKSAPLHNLLSCLCSLRSWRCPGTPRQRLVHRKYSWAVSDLVRSTDRLPAWGSWFEHL